MLNKAERFRVLKIYRIFSSIALLPTQVDLASWKLKVPSIGKRFICFLSFCLFVLHALYKIGGLAYAYFFDPNVQIHQLVIHAVVAMTSAMTLFWYGKVYISDSALHAKSFNMTLLGNVGGPLGSDDELEKHWKTRLREYSRQDLIAICMPYMIVLGTSVITTTYVYDPTMRLLLFNALPNHLQTWTTFGMLLLEEARFLMVLTAIVVPILQLQVISYDLVSNQLEKLIQKIQNGIPLKTKSLCISLRTIQLYVSMLNNVNCYLVFTWKLLSISESIISGYSAVAHFKEHPIFGIMYYFILIDVVIIYTVIYEKAFKVPQLFRRASTSALLHRCGKQRDIFRRQIRSIRTSGFKVGSFHELERTSTPNFIDFVLRNIVSMLVAYG